MAVRLGDRFGGYLAVQLTDRSPSHDRTLPSRKSRRSLRSNVQRTSPLPRGADHGQIVIHVGASVLARARLRTTWLSPYASLLARARLRTTWLSPYASVLARARLRTTWLSPYASLLARARLRTTWSSPYASLLARVQGLA